MKTRLQLTFRGTRTRLGLACALSAVLAGNGLAGDVPRIRRIELVHLSHTDIGFTDHQSVSRDLHVRYLDIALDAIAATRDRPEAERFRWTAEATLPVHDWWFSASDGRRAELLRAVRDGQLEITALPFNLAPFQDADEWRTLLRWGGDEPWQALPPRSAMQNDVNGFPRAGALALLDRGVHYFWMGINADSGGPPLSVPSAFWWRMPDGRRLLVWLGLHYAAGFDFFERAAWRRGPVPSAADTGYRPPRPGEQFAADEASVRAAHRLCTEKLRDLEKSGYPYPTLILPTTNQWRMDNDPPFPPLADFVATWNRLGLAPELRLSTPADAMARLERESGDRVPEYAGEWPDWWANGTAARPRELAASRRAKRLLAAALSPVWGAPDDATGATAESIRRDLCLFDEHTGGAAMSVADPWSFETLGQFDEKARLAWKPLAEAGWLLARRARARAAGAGPGVHVANPAPGPYTGWARVAVDAFREPSVSLHDPATGRRYALSYEAGFEPWGRPQKPEDLSRENQAAVFPDRAPRKTARLWVEGLPARSLLSLRASTEPVEDAAAKRPVVEPGPRGWPAAVRWDGTRSPLFTAGFGDFVSTQVEGFAPRSLLADLGGTADPAAREALRGKIVREVPAEAEGDAQVEETAHTLLFSQWLSHPRLQWAVRRLEIWKREPRARLTLRLYRTSSDAPERFFLSFPLPTGAVLPTLSNGGAPFTPFTDQVPGSCRDYFAIDGWAHYAAPLGHWLWASRDAALVGFGRPPAWDRRSDPPQDAGRLLAMLFDNFWYTNFDGNSHGAMEFQFDLVWREALRPEERAAVVDSLLVEPVVVVEPAVAEDAATAKRLRAGRPIR